MQALEKRFFQIFHVSINSPMVIYILHVFHGLVLSFIILTSPLIAQTNIAVLNFTARDVTGTEAQVVSDRIRIALQKSSDFTVIERNLMDRLLKEQSLQQSGCTESDCMVEVGKLLSVKQIVGGSLSKMGNQLIIEAKLINVETGEILNNVIKDFTGPYELLLSQVVPEVADKLGRKTNTNQQKPELNIALLEFVSRGLTDTEAAIISDRIRLELKNTGRYNVLEREMMKAILQEQSFQQSGCTDSECLVEVGQLLSVEKMVGGSISKIGNLYVIEARIIDVATGSIDHNVAEDYSGPIELLLVNTTKTVARKLAGQETTAAPSTDAIYSGQADITISSVPGGGVVYFDGAPLNQVTPSTFKNMPAGVHKIKVTKGELYAEEEVELARGRLNNINLILKEKTYTLIIYSAPAGASVKVGSKLLGKTPTEYTYKKTDVPFDLIISAAYYFPDTTHIDNIDQLVSRIDAKLGKGGRIKVNSTPGSDVYIDGKKIAPTPYSSGLLKLDTYKIELKNELYQSVNLNAVLSESQPRFEKHVNLTRKIGNLSLTVQPVGSTVFLDNQYLNMDNKKSIPVPYGNHKLKVIKKGYYKHISAVEILSEREYEKSIQLSPKSKTRAVLLSTIIPGTGQMYFGSYEKGIVYSAITFGLVYYTMTFNDKFAENWDQYAIDLENYRNATSVSEIERTKALKDISYDEAIKYRNLTIGSMGVTGIFWLVNIWDAGHNFRQLKKNIELSANNPGTVMLSYKF
ncbi:MAG: PEGA domain-containing protein [bacterium]